MDAAASTLKSNTIRQGALKGTSQPQETLVEKIRWQFPKTGKWVIYFIDEMGTHERELELEGSTVWCLSADKTCRVPVLELPEGSTNMHDGKFVLRQSVFNLGIAGANNDMSVPEYTFGEDVLPDPPQKKSKKPTPKAAPVIKGQGDDLSIRLPQVGISDTVIPLEAEQLYRQELTEAGAKVISFGKHRNTVTAEVVVMANGLSYTFHLKRLRGVWYHRLGVFEASLIPLLCELRRVRRVEPEIVDDDSPTEFDADRAEAIRNQRIETIKRRKAGRRLVAQLVNRELSAKLMAAEDAILRRREAEQKARTKAEAKGSTVHEQIDRQVAATQKERALVEDRKLAAESRRRPAARTADEHDQQRERWNSAKRPTERVNDNVSRATRGNQNRRRVS